MKQKLFKTLLIMMFMITGQVANASEVTAKEARQIAKEAYIFNYPLVMYYRTMYMQAIDTKSTSYSGGFGKWLNLGTSSPKDTGWSAFSLLSKNSAPKANIAHLHISPSM